MGEWEDIERLRREGPAYTGDEGWEEMLPPKEAVLSVRFDIPTMRRLFGIAKATQRTPSGLLRDWTIERLSTTGSLVEDDRHAHAIREASGIIADDIEDLRRSYRPDRVRLLLVGESSPASGRFFYRANSNLFHAVRFAFEGAFGPMPAGVAFLDEFRRRGGWLVDVAERPVNRLRGRPRADAVDAGLEQLAATIADTRPDMVVAVKSTLEGPVRRAAHTAGVSADAVHVLPFPVRQWRRQFVVGLMSLLQGSMADEFAAKPLAPRGLTLHHAMAVVLKEIGCAPARTVANEVNRRGLYRRGDGRSIDYQQILARAKKHPDRFRVTHEGLDLI